MNIYIENVSSNDVCICNNVIFMNLTLKQTHIVKFKKYVYSYI